MSPRGYRDIPFVILPLRQCRNCGFRFHPKVSLAVGIFAITLGVASFGFFVLELALLVKRAFTGGPSFSLLSTIVWILLAGGACCFSVQIVFVAIYALRGPHGVDRDLASQAQ